MKKKSFFVELKQISVLYNGQNNVSKKQNQNSL